MPYVAKACLFKRFYICMLNFYAIINNLLYCFRKRFTSPYYVAWGMRYEVWGMRPMAITFIVFGFGHRFVPGCLPIAQLIRSILWIELIWLRNENPPCRRSEKKQLTIITNCFGNYYYFWTCSIWLEMTGWSINLQKKDMWWVYINKSDG